MPSDVRRAGSTPYSTKYALTASARRCESPALYASDPVQSVHPRIVIFSEGSLAAMTLRASFRIFFPFFSDLGFVKSEVDAAQFNCFNLTAVFIEDFFNEVFPKRFVFHQIVQVVNASAVRNRCKFFDTVTFGLGICSRNNVNACLRIGRIERFERFHRIEMSVVRIHLK